MISKRLLRQIESVDWDFPTSLPGTTEAIHWYPGTFPAQVPATIIQALTSPDDIIFDPYAGIGTTAAEAIRLGRRTWIADNNPARVLAAYTKTGLMLLRSTDPLSARNKIELLEALIESLKPKPKAGLALNFQIFEHGQSDSMLQRMLRPHATDISHTCRGSDIPHWDLLAPWFEDRTLSIMQHLYRSIESADISEFTKLVGFTMLSAILRPACSQTRSWGHIADNVLPKSFESKNVYTLCSRWLNRLKNIIHRADAQLLSNKECSNIRAWVCRHNWDDNFKPIPRPRKAPSLLITSPPYSCAIDYVLSQRLSLYLLGYDNQQIQDLCRQEIGARRKRFSSDARTIWATQLCSALNKQLEFLSNSGIVVYILPHKEAGREIGATLLEEQLIDGGWNKLFEIHRSIRQGRARQSWTSIKKETIIGYQSS